MPAGGSNFTPLPNDNHLFSPDAFSFVVQTASFCCTAFVSFNPLPPIFSLHFRADLPAVSVQEPKTSKCVCAPSFVVLFECLFLSFSALLALCTNLSFSDLLSCSQAQRIRLSKASLEASGWLVWKCLRFSLCMQLNRSKTSSVIHAALFHSQDIILDKNNLNSFWPLRNKDDLSRLRLFFHTPLVPLVSRIKQGQLNAVTPLPR